MDMKEIVAVVLIIAVFLAVVLGLTWIIQGNDFFMYKFFAPKMEQVKREVFEKSKEYQHGTIQELDKMRLEYVKTNDADIKAAIGIRALRMVAEFDKSKLPADLREWIYSIESKH